MKNYKIMHNGGIPFRVIVNKDTKTADIWMLGQYENFTPDEYVRLKTVEYQTIYIGKDPRNFTEDMGEFWEKSYEGNSIVLQLYETKHMFIGMYVYTFDLEDGDVIKKYYSPMGPNGVPYPFIVGHENTYFMIEKQFVPNIHLDSAIEPYGQLYKRIKRPLNKDIKNFKMIRNSLYR